MVHRKDNRNSTEGERHYKMEWRRTELKARVEMQTFGGGETQTDTEGSNQRAEGLFNPGWLCNMLYLAIL